MSLGRGVQTALFVAAAAVWCAAACAFSPPFFAYTAAFVALCFIVFALTYWLPVAGWWTFLALGPVVNIPSRALALGAHHALVFLSLAFVLGWWANRLVTRRQSELRASVVVPLLFVMFIAVSSGVWTMLRYTDFYPLATSTFRNGWVNAAGLLASEAVSRTAFATLNCLVFPSLFIASYSVWRGIFRESPDPGRASGKLVTVWAVALVPVLLIALYQSVYDPGFCMLTDTAWQEASRASGGMTDPNALALFLFLYVPLAVVCALRERGIRQIVLACSAILCMYVVTLTGSRSALLGLLVTALITASVLLIRSLAARGNKLKTVAAAGAVLVVLLVMLPIFSNFSVSSGPSENPLLNRLQRFRERSRFSPSARLVDRREWQWNQAITMWKDYSFAGIGVGAFPTELANYNREASTETPVDNAWNQYLHWLAEIGLAGVVFWLWFYAAYVACLVSGIRSMGGVSVSGTRTTKTGIRAGMTLPMLVIISTLLALQLLHIFGAHMQAPEVSFGTAVLSSFVLAAFSPADRKPGGLSRRDLIVLLLAGAIICAAQGQYALGPLSRRAVQKRYDLPTEFGFYNVEDWQGQFAYQWTRKYAGRQVTVPRDRRVLSLRMAVINPDVSKESPKRVTVRLDDTFLDTLSLDSPVWQTHDIYIHDFPQGPATLTIECDDTWSPPHEAPPRALGVAVATNITWRAQFNRDCQGLSEWHEHAEGNSLVPFRWTGRLAARKITIGPRGIIKLGLRAPTDVPFYRAPLSVKIAFDDCPLQTFELPRSSSEWLWVDVVVKEQLRGRTGILSLAVNRLSTIRVKGTVRRRRVGVALARIETK